MVSEVPISKEQEEMIEALIKDLPTLRKHMGISQTALGEKIGLSRQSISSIERGATRMTWNAYLSFMMFFTMNSGNMFYFPRKNDYKYTKHLEKLLKIMKNDTPINL
ncbi:helix-turn-helix transcriptional regulator [Acidaminobacter sp.]|uniref:helix-turn-helix transcriptional regulator n=1 Tax=Acidaminobacter sp. TaxID=1872102 RepID=UPI0026184806|nr:helix-turn-helix transcriptional regulator [Acidaminobacter sp.]